VSLTCTFSSISTFFARIYKKIKKAPAKISKLFIRSHYYKTLRVTIYKKETLSCIFAKTQSMDNTIVIFSAIIILLIVAFLVFVLIQKRNVDVKQAATETLDNNTRSLRLQAYERLTLLVDRIALPNLISRVNQNGITAREMQMLLTRNLKEEFDYNITQQIYVSADAWNAVKNLKEQNMLVVNQLASALPPNATGLDLNKLLLEYLMTDKKGQLHEVVSEVLSYEAKKLM
jgi:hypothetical protein